MNENMNIIKYQYNQYKYDFKSFLKIAVEPASLIWCGSEFHSDGPATEKALSPIRFLLEGIESRVLSIADLVTGPIEGIEL